MAAARRLDRSAISPAAKVRTAPRRRDRSARSMETRVWTPAPIMWKKMKRILSHRRPRVVKLQEVAKHAKSWGLRSSRRMQGCLLPFEIVATILSRLPVKSLLRFRCVCKEWHSLTYNHNFIKEHHACAQALGRIALISRRYLSPEISHYDFGDNGELKNQAFSVRFGERNGYKISNQANGLVCVVNNDSYMCDEDSQYLLSPPMCDVGCHYLLNPATRELAKLPTSGNGNGERDTSAGLGLGFDGSTGGFKLVKLFRIEGPSYRCGCKVLEVGTQEWREVGRAHCRIPVGEPVHVNGAIHWMSLGRRANNFNIVERKIMAFDLKDEKFRSIRIPRECEALYGGTTNLVEWEGLLCIVKIPILGPVTSTMTGGRPLVRIWRLEDAATGRWGAAHCGELPKYKSIDDWLRVAGIRGHEMLLVINRGGGLGSICSYDLRTRSLRELYSGDAPRGLQFLAESLVSPRYLAGKLSLH